MRTIMTSVAAAALLAACSESAPPPPAEETTAASLQPGEYEITATVESLRSTDKTTPATKAKVGDPPVITKACLPADGAFEPKVFAEAKESCTAMDTYLRNGRMNLQYKCKRGGDQLTQLVDGDFKADSFEATVRTATYFAGTGDYDLVRKYSGKRVGDCTAEPAKS